MSLHSECAGKTECHEPFETTGREWIFFEEAPTNLAKVSEDGICLRMNRRLSGLLGRKPGEKIPLESLVHPEDTEAGRLARQELLRGDSNESVWTCRFLASQDRLVSARVRASLIREGSQKPPFFLLAVEELSPSVAASPEWKEAYELILESTRQVLYELDPATGELKLTGDVLNLTGYGSGEISGEWEFWERLVHPDDRHLLEQRLQTCADGKPYHLEYRIFRKDGTIANVRDDGCAAARDAGGGRTQARLIGALLDVSEQRSLALQLQHAQKMEVFGRLAGGVAHDFNNLLTVFSGYTELLISEYPGGDPKREYLDEMQRATERAVALTSQLLAFGRLQRSTPRLLDLGEVLLEIQKMLRRLIGEDIELVTALADGVGLVFADPRQIETVLINLAVNARDAMPHGGRLSIETSNFFIRPNDRRVAAGWKPGSYVQIAVSDTGVGIDPSLFGRIFEPFFTTKGPGEGTGLGLSTCYGIVEQCGGRIEVESVPGRGSTFRICLPRVKRQEVKEAHGDLLGSRPRGKLPKGKGETILFVEDDPAVQRIYTTMLRRLGYEVLVGSNGDEAMRIASEHPEICLVLTDLVMPLMSGTELAEELRHLLPNAKIVLTSGYASEPGAQTGPIAGTTFLPKPLSRDILACKLRELIESA